MLILIRPIHRWAKKYDVKHHHILLAWLALCLLIPAATIFATLGVTFSSTAQVLSVFVMGASLGVFFFILLLAEESRITEENEKTRSSSK